MKRGQLPSLYIVIIIKSRIPSTFAESFQKKQGVINMKRIVLLVLILLLVPATLFAAEIKLTEDTDLHPQGWIAGSLTFKGGTTVILNDSGEVISGTLSASYGEYLESAGQSSIMGFEHTSRIPGLTWYREKLAPVVFNSRGQVIRGMLAEDTLVRVCSEILPNVRAKAGTILAFKDNRAVDFMTIVSDTYLRPSGWETLSLPNAGFVKFKSNTVVTFGNKGEVLSGTLAEETKIGKKVYPAGTQMTFSE
jgi:hypothetical protein